MTGARGEDPDRPAGAVRVATFNVLHGRPVRDGRPAERPDGHAVERPLAEAVAALGADVLALQEVDRLLERSGAVDQARAAADAAGAVDWRFAAAVHGRWEEVRGWVPDPAAPELRLYGPDDRPAAGETPAHGTALISRLPVLRWRALRLAPAPAALPLRMVGRRGLTVVRDRPRAAVAAVLEGPRGPFTAVALHLSFVPGWNIRQLLTVRARIADLPGPHVLLGDFNLVGALPRLTLAAAERAARAGGVSGGRAPGGPVGEARWWEPPRTATYPSHRPVVQFDHVLVRGLPAAQPSGPAATPLTPISDHRPLVVGLPL